MDSILDKGYATFMEDTLRDMVALPVEGICIVAKLKGGGHMMNYYRSSPVDKLTYAGLIQQNAIVATLQANNWIPKRDADTE